MKTLKAQSILIALAFAVGATITGCEDKIFEPEEPGLLVPKTVDQDGSLPQISVNGTNLHAETYGNAADPMMVVLHGGPGGDYRSMLNCKAFANQGYFVIFYDQRGSGLSRRHPKKIYDMDLMIEDLSAVLHHYRHSDDQKVFLLGHSWGAMLATAYIDRYPSMIAGAILSEPGGFNWKDTKDYILRTRETNLLSEDLNDVFYYDQIFTGKEDEHEILDYKFALMTAHDHADGNAIGNAGPTPFWRSGAIVQKGLFETADEDGFDFTKNLNQFTTPVLFLYSELNSAYGLTHAQNISSAYPNVQLTLIHGSGHDIPYFGWNTYYPIALEYLNHLK